MPLKYKGGPGLGWAGLGLPGWAGLFLPRSATSGLGWAAKGSAWAGLALPVGAAPGLGWAGVGLALPGSGLGSAWPCLAPSLALRVLPLWLGPFCSHPFTPFCMGLPRRAAVPSCK